MEAIQQKVELSQQLEEWKTDMEQLLEEQIRDRLVHSEEKSRRRKSSQGGGAGVGDGRVGIVSERLFFCFLLVT